MSPAVDQAELVAARCSGYLSTAAGVIAMADGGTEHDLTHALHCAELIIGVVQEQLAELETKLIRAVLLERAA